MESVQRAVLTNKAPLSEEDWDELIDFIREEYLVRDRGINDVLESLKQRKPQMTLTLFRGKLNEWGFKKNLSRDDWQYVGRLIKERVSQQKESIVILSGMRLSPNKVKKQVNRTKDATLSRKFGLSTVLESPKEDAVYVCTPRATSPAIATWPDSLPWLQFSQSIFPKLLEGLRFLPENETGTAITISPTQHSRPCKKRRFNPSLAWIAFEKLVRRSMEIVIGSEELTKALLSSRSVDRIAEHLDRLVPTTYANENIIRAMLLTDGRPQEVQRETLKILLFLVSNHLIMDYKYCSRERYIADAQALVDICRYSGITEPQVVTRIVQASLHSLTMTAMLDLLYEAAVNTETVTLVSILLDVDKRIDPDRCVGRTWRFDKIYHWSGLQFAILRDSLELANCMFRHGANTNCYGEAHISPLVIAASVCPDQESGRYIPLLLRYGAIINDKYGPSALFVAIQRGHFKLIDQLHKAGANLSFTYSASDFEDFIYKLYVCLGLTLFKDCRYRFEFLDDITSLGLAVSFLGKRSEIDEIDSEDDIYDEGDKDDGDDTFNKQAVLKLIKFIINLAGSAFDPSGDLKSDAMIHAASRGYTNVISFLHGNGAHVNSKNGFLCPVYAAVNWRHTKTCRQLLALGGSIETQRRVRKLHNLSAQLSPLHIAAYRNSCALVRLLVEVGVDVNLISQIQNNPLSSYIWRGSPEYGSALNMASACCSWDVALLLLDLGATPTSYDLTQAIYHGQSLLVSRLLSQLPGSEVKRVEDKLHNLIIHARAQKALEILDLGLPIDHEKALCLAIEHNKPKLAVKLIEGGIKLTAPQLIWAFRILDGSKLRAYVRSIDLDFTLERDPDNRSLLENAISSGNLDTMELALSFNPPAYDSGALCAAKILQRRESENQHDSFFDPVLENTAISIAAYHSRLDIISLLQKYSDCEINNAVLPEGLRGIGSLRSLYDVLATIGSQNMTLQYCVRGDDLFWGNWHNPDRGLTSPLLLAVESGNELLIEELLRMGYRPDAYTLRAALYRDVSFDLASRLIEKSRDANVFQATGRDHCFTAVYLAAMLDRLDLMKKMLAKGANSNAASPYICSAILGLMIERGKFDAVDTLLQTGTDIKDALGPDGWGKVTALEAAARMGHIGILRRLLECRADPNSMGIAVGSAIVAAASRGRLDAVQLLLHHGAGKEGRGRINCILAMGCATRAGHSAVVQLLKTYQPWTDENEKLLNYLNYLRRRHGNGGVIGIIIDYGRDTEEEIDEFLAFAEDGYMLVLEIGSGVKCRVMGRAKKARQEIIARRQEQWNLESGVVGPGGCGRSDITANRVPAAIDSGGEVFGQQNEPESLDAANLTDRDLDDVDEILDTGKWCKDAGNESENIQFGPHGMAEEDKMEYQSLLKDILGEEEMPFEPVEQPW